MKRFLLFSLVSLFILQAGASTVAGFFGKDRYKHATISVCVRNINTGKTLESMNKSQAVVPASVMKLITTATAMELLGPNHRFKTVVQSKGKIIDGVLSGDIYIIGGGDPSLGSRRFGSDQYAFLNEWAEAISKAGIKVVNGNVIADPGLFDDEHVSPYWMWEDMGNYYAAGIYGLGVFDNSYQLKLRSGSVGTRPEVLSVTPPMPGMTIDNQLVAADNDKDSAYIYGAPYQWNRSLFGTIPANRSSFSIRGDMPDPPYFAAYLLCEALIRKGIEVKGQPMSTHSMPENYIQQKPVTDICSTLSVSLLKMIDVIHARSDNFYTEYLLRHISLTASDKPASARNGLMVIRDFWEQKGLDVSSLYMADGCGLSPMNRVSAGFLTELLEYMAIKSKYADIYEKSLPLAGVQGSVSGFLKGTKLEGKIRLKSGSMQGVNSYAGYYHKNGQIYVVVMMANHLHMTGSKVCSDMEDFLLSL